METTKSLCQICVYTVHVPMKKFHLFEPWNLFAKLSWAHVCTVYVPMIILVKRGQKLCSGAGGGVFFNPKILIKASPSMRISQSPCQVFPNLCFCNFMFLWLFLWKGAKIAWGARGLLFLTPKSLLRHSHLWEQLNIFVKLSQTHVSLVYVPMIIVFERGAEMTPPV